MVQFAVPRYSEGDVVITDFDQIQKCADINRCHDENQALQGLLEAVVDRAMPTEAGAKTKP